MQETTNLLKCSVTRDQDKKFKKKTSSQKYHLTKLVNISPWEIMPVELLSSKSNNPQAKSKMLSNIMLSSSHIVDNSIHWKVSKSLKPSPICNGSEHKASIKNLSLQMKETSRFGNFMKSVSKKSVNQQARN